MIQQTPTEMLRDVMGTISETCRKMSESAMGLNTEGVKSQFLTLERSMKILGVIEREIIGARAAVVHCANCEHCMSLEMVDPMKPYSGSGEGFFCMRWDNEFYAPAYRAETWFCADGIPRKEGEDGMK